MDWIVIGFILQTAGSALLLGGYAPQIFKLHKTLNSIGISKTFWTMIGTGCTLILANMIIQGTSTPVIITQGLNAVCAWYTLGLVIYCDRKAGIKTDFGKAENVFILAVLVVGAYGFYADSINQLGQLLQLGGTVALLFAYIPQMVHLYSVKDATGISRWLFIVLGSGLLLVTVNMIISGTNKYIIATEFVNIGLIMIQYFMTVYYQKNR
jgi:uncharacterized protein with PQ loop repeat